MGIYILVKNRKTSVRVALEAGADVNGRAYYSAAEVDKADQEGQTPLHATQRLISARSGCSSCMCMGSMGSPSPHIEEDPEEHLSRSSTLAGLSFTSGPLQLSDQEGGCSLPRLGVLGMCLSGGPQRSSHVRTTPDWPNHCGM